MTAAAPASVRHAAAKATLELSFKIPTREWFTLREAGAVLGLSESTAEKLYDSGKLTGHSHNAGSGERQHKRVLRISLIAYALRSADYTDESLLDCLISSMRYLPREGLFRLAEAAKRFAQEKSA